LCSAAIAIHAAKAEVIDPLPMEEYGEEGRPA